MKAAEIIDKIRCESRVPFIDVICKSEGEEIFRHRVGDCSGKELLYMFSCSKVVTVCVAMRLVEEGRLSLDAPVCYYLPEVGEAFVLSDEQRIKVGEAMTVRHLFTMSAGFSYDLSTEPILRLVRESGAGAELRDFISAFVEAPLSFFPGERYQYSLCHDVLAAVVEVACGERFSDYVRKTVFEPLGMKNSRFDNGERGVAPLYQADGAGNILRTSCGKYLSPTPRYESGGAGMVSTVEDYGIFADTLASGGISKSGYRLLGKKWLDLLRTEQIEGVNINNGFTCVQGEDYGYGLGVRVRRTPLSWGLGKGEYGWDGAAGSYVMIDPTRKISVFVGMHLRGWPTVFQGRHLEIVEGIYKEFFKVKKSY